MSRHFKTLRRRSGSSQMLYANQFPSPVAFAQGGTPPNVNEMFINGELYQFQTINTTGNALFTPTGYTSGGGSQITTPAYEAFDENPLTYSWYDNTPITAPFSLRVKFPQARVYNEVEIFSGIIGGTTYDPRNITIIASNSADSDGIWNSLGFDIGVGYPSLSKTISFANTTPYLFYGISLTFCNEYPNAISSVISAINRVIWRNI